VFLEYSFSFKKEKEITDNIAVPSAAYFTHAYILSRKGATNLLKYLDGKLFNHIDFCIQKLVLDNKIESYITTPRIAYQTSTDSTKSENVMTNYPIIPNKLLSKIYIDKMVTAQYLFSLSLFRLGNININIFTLIFFLLSFIFMIKNIDIKKITIIFLIISLPDIILIKNENDMQTILFYYFILILPSFFKNIYYK
jgi:hypothetical protein